MHDKNDVQQYKTSPSQRKKSAANNVRAVTD